MATPRPRKNVLSSSSVSQSPAPSWTDDLPVCHLSAIGISTNQIYRQDGAREEEHEFEDRFFHFRDEFECYLYGVFDGHDGMQVADFARLRLPAELLLGQLLDVTNDAAVKEILHNAFHTVERSYFESLDEVLAERTNLKLQLPEELNDYELYQQFPTEVDKLQALDSQIIVGASANIALIISEKLYVANVGDSRTILCISAPDGSLSVKQLSIDHTVLNDDEMLRLQQLGLEVTQVEGNQQLGSSNTTRKIGDHSLKGGYKEHVMLSLAKSEPVIAEPEVIGGLLLNGMSGFLAMFTGGLHKSLTDATATTQVNVDIAKMIAAEFSVQTTLSGVTQGVVDKVVRIHHDTYLEKGPRAGRCQKREDITLLVRNFGFPLGTNVGSPMSQFNPVTVPYTPGATSAQRPTLFIPPRPGFPGLLSSSPQPTRVLRPDQIVPISPTMVPLTINVTDTMSPTSSRTSTVGSPTSSSVSTPCSNLNDSNQDSRYNTSDSDTQRSGEELLLFQRLQVASPRPTEPDEEGYIEPYVDFTEFNEAFNAAIQDNLLSQ